MRELGPFDKRTPRKDVKSGRGWPKPDNARKALSAQELHAYYIALISSARLCATPDGLRLLAR